MATKKKQKKQKVAKPTYREVLASVSVIEQRQMRIERRLGLRNPSLQEGDFNKRLADLELLWDLLGAEVFKLLKHTGLVRRLKRELRALLMAQQERLRPKPWRDGNAIVARKI